MPSQIAFETISRRNSSELQAIVDRYAKGQITPEEFGDQFYDALVTAHTDAYGAGLKYGDSQLDPLVIQSEAAKFGRAQADSENEWLDKFVADLENGRYLDSDGNLRVDAISSRADLYNAKLRASGGQGWVDASAANDPQEEFTWVMGGERHCHDCPRLAALSPYKVGELFTTPGAGDCECLGNCNCYLVRSSDGKSSFKPAA